MAKSIPWYMPIDVKNRIVFRRNPTLRIVSFISISRLFWSHVPLRITLLTFRSPLFGFQCKNKDKPISIYQPLLWGPLRGSGAKGGGAKVTKSDLMVACIGFEISNLWFAHAMRFRPLILQGPFGPRYHSVWWRTIQVAGRQGGGGAKVTSW